MPFYRLLLALFCPVSFRNEYGAEMTSVFQRRLGERKGVFGMIGVYLEGCADVVVAGVASHFDLLWQDLRYAARSARRSPGFTVSVVGVTALGVSAATAVFTIADHILLRPLPFLQPDRIVKLWDDRPSIGYSRLDVSPANYRDWKRMSGSFESMAAFTNVSYNISGSGEPERIVAGAVNSELFHVLGVHPLIGRTFTEAEDQGGAA